MGLITYKDDKYLTEGTHGSLLPSLIGYYRMFMIVYSNARLAKHAPYGAHEWEKASFSILQILEDVGVKFHIEGLEHVRDLDGPCVFIGNHMSTLETFLLPCLLLPYKHITFVVKESLTTYPVFGPIMSAVDPITVTRTNPRKDLKDVMEKGNMELNEKGKSIIIFPQTTRSNTFDPEHFNSIGIKLAKRANVPVIPIALKTNAWSNGSILKDFGRIYPTRPVHFAFGKPMDVEGRGNDTHQAVIEFIQNKFKVWDTD
ncbi:lysophospholipid acyltransferase family protein [Nitrospirota bacterium]